VCVGRPARVLAAEPRRGAEESLPPRDPLRRVRHLRQRHPRLAEARHEGPRRPLLEEEGLARRLGLEAEVAGRPAAAIPPERPRLLEDEVRLVRARPAAAQAVRVQEHDVPNTQLAGAGSAAFGAAFGGASPQACLGAGAEENLPCSARLRLRSSPLLMSCCRADSASRSLNPRRTKGVSAPTRAAVHVLCPSVGLAQAAEERAPEERRAAG